MSVWNDLLSTNDPYYAWTTYFLFLIDQIILHGGTQTACGVSVMKDMRVCCVSNMSSV